MEIPKIKVERSELSELIVQMKKGQLQVPRFQRDFVWPVTKTRKLFDSIFKEFPIGTFFFWKAPADLPPLFRSIKELDIQEPSPGSEITYILDGQQRLASLFAAIRGIIFYSRNYGKICLDLKSATEYMNNTAEGFEKDIFVSRKPNNQRYVSVKDILGIHALEIADQIPSEYKLAFNKAFHIFKTYPFSVVRIQEQTLSDAIVIFQRINQEGKRLSRYDLVCANLWRQDFDFRKKVKLVNKEFKEKGFGAIHTTIFTQTFSLIINDHCTTVAELTMKTDDVRRTWDDVIKSLKLAVDFAKNNLGVIRAGLLPYRGILVVLAYYFYYSPSTALSVEQREILWQFFWRVTLSERYSTTSPSRMAEDASILRKSLDGNEVSFDYPLIVNSEQIARTRMTRTTSALRNAFLCLLALKGPKNFKDNSLIDLTHTFFSKLNQPERHHIFPVGYLREKGLSNQVHRIPNFCFIPANLNKEIGKQAPSTYFTHYRDNNEDFEISINTHLIPFNSESAIWENEFDDFIKERAELITSELLRLIDLTPDELHRESVPLTYDPLRDRIDSLESRIRDFLDLRFVAVSGQAYWRRFIPGDIKDYVKVRIEQHLSNHPYEDPSVYSTGRARLNFCTVGHYSKILLSNWDIFEENFGDKNNVIQHFGAYSNLRNGIHHNRQVSDIDRQLGEAGMTWVERVIDRYDLETEDEGEIEESEEEFVLELE